MNYIHILRGTGDNCTCTDCVVLYGGECATTKDNNFLDDLEIKVLKYLNFTPTGRVRKISDAYMDSCINNIVRPAIRKYTKCHRNQFNRYYYGFMPLLYLMTSTRKEGARLWYRRSRNMLYTDIVDEVLSASTMPIEYD